MCSCAYTLPSAQNFKRVCEVLLVGKKISIHNLWYNSDCPCVSVLPLTKCVGSRKVAVSTFIGKRKPYVLVSLASLCMISKIILQAEEQPSGVEWTLMAFSAAPAFSFLCTSILRTTRTGWLVSRPWGKWVFSGPPNLSSTKGTGAALLGTKPIKGRTGEGQGHVTSLLLWILS